LISKARIKEIKALHLPKFRQIYNKFIAEGDKVCIELLKNPKYTIDQVFIAAGNEAAFEKYYTNKMIDPEIISPREMEQISLLKTPSGILMLLDKKEDDVKVLLNKEASIIYLDGVQDPGNVGTIIRLADWFGVDAVVRSEDTADFFNPKVVQATMGSMVNVKLATMSLEALKTDGIPIYGTFMDGEDVRKATIEKGAILVMGSEGRGISNQYELMIDHKLTIPGVQGKIAESLNVAVAAGIVCAAWRR